MERLARRFAALGLGTMLLATGCRTARDEVPPGRAFRNDGRRDQAIGLGTQPHTPPITAFGGPTGSGSRDAATGQAALPPDGGDFTGAIPGNFGVAGTSGLGAPPAIGGVPSSSAPAGPGAGDGYPPAPPTRKFDVGGDPSLSPPPY